MTFRPPCCRGSPRPSATAYGAFPRQFVLLVALWITAGLVNPAASGQPLRADTSIDVRSLLTLAEQGDARASFLLGTRYASGRAGVRDDSEAVRWFEKAAQKGLAEAQYNLGVMYATGRGVAQDWTRAVRWYRRAAEQGSPEAQYNLGTLYGLGRGLERDERQAASWLRKAAEQGLPEAQYNLAVLYEHGRGVHLDAREAIRWFSAAADEGHEAAKTRLAALRARLQQPAQGAAAAPESLAGAQSAERADGQTPLRSAQWLGTLDPAHYTVQVASQNEEARAQRFIRQHALESQAAYFPSVRDGVTWYSIVIGVHPTMEAARAALAALPARLRKSRPWVRNIGVIQRAMMR